MHEKIDCMKTKEEFVPLVTGPSRLPKDSMAGFMFFCDGRTPMTVNK